MPESILLIQSTGTERSHLCESSAVKIYSLSHLMEIACNLPDPATAAKAQAGYSPVIRVRLDGEDGIGYTDPGELTASGAPEPYVEFEIMQWTDANGVTRPRWVLRGLVAM